MAYGSPVQTADRWLARLGPVMVLTMLIVITALPAPFDQAHLPDVVLTGVYIASARRTPAVAPLTLFGLGLLHDLLGSVPIGLHAFVYVLVYALASRLPVDGRRMLPLWLGFIPVALLAAVASWFAVSVYHLVWLTPDPVLARAAASLIAFPLLALPLMALLGHDRHGP